MDPCLLIHLCKSILCFTTHSHLSLLCHCWDPHTVWNRDERMQCISHCPDISMGASYYMFITTSMYQRDCQHLWRSVSGAVRGCRQRLCNWGSQVGGVLPDNPVSGVNGRHRCCSERSCLLFPGSAAAPGLMEGWRMHLDTNPCQLHERSHFRGATYTLHLAMHLVSMQV